MHNHNYKNKQHKFKLYLELTVLATNLILEIQLV